MVCSVIFSQKNGASHMSVRATLPNNTTVKGDGCGRLSLEQRKIILKLYSTSEAVYKQTESPN
jgi:hypothetical protein